MLSLDSFNLSIQTTLTELFSSEKPISIDRVFSDFDNTLFHISTPDPSQKTKIVLSIFLKCYEDLIQYGQVSDYLKTIYDDSEYQILSTPEDGYNFSILIDLETLNDETKKQELINKFSLLKRHCLAAPFEKTFEKYDELSKNSIIINKNGVAEENPAVHDENARQLISIIRYREDETIYIRPSHDRVTVIFTALFKDETDKIFGNIFLQEFVDARKRSIQNAPQVLYSPIEPPLELRSLPEFQNFDPSIGNNSKGFVTFVLFPRHLVAQKRDNTISQIQLFRTYFHYHIKASKAYLHSRMRKRVLEYLKILNRAKPDQEEKDIERKTASGRRFIARA